MKRELSSIIRFCIWRCGEAAHSGGGVDRVNVGAALERKSRFGAQLPCLENIAKVRAALDVRVG